ncbi:MAG: nickel pincer cofactor biosynthesis protein LarC, partial [Candidatus Omnitrophica bacterium]|nr:nickel pincer cofactor biosynthesis protein LarC [Candidatus Omnitrophota bacterium]
YFDCFSGISGDMVLGAFVDSGLKLSALKKELSKLSVRGYELRSRRVARGHISATKIDVVVTKNVHYPHVDQIYRLIDRSGIDAGAKKIAKDIYALLADAEAAVHRKKPGAVHFHQLGELDTIVDIVGCAVAIRLLGVEKLYASGLTLGSGMVKAGTEIFPLPAPATLRLLKDRTVSINAAIGHELVTPTGAAIVAALTEEIPEAVPFRVGKVGYGAGTYTDAVLPNVLTLVLAEAEAESVQDRITVVEANFDDMLALNVELLFERLFSAGALDVFTAPVMMKKMRQGMLLHVACPTPDAERIITTIFQETTTLGVRIRQVTRRKLERKILNMKTEYGIIVQVKIATLRGRVVTVSPEYEDCKNIARQRSLPFKTVYDRIKAQALEKFKA